MEIGRVRDPDGREVVLSAERWEHIVDSHPELESHHEAVLVAVLGPGVRIAGREENEEWFYIAGAGPSQWLKVVVSYEGRAGRIITAFPRRSIP